MTTFKAMMILLAVAVLAACGRPADEAPPPASAFELVWSTYWGGAPQANKGNAIAVDAEGYIYLAGETQCPSFPLKNPVSDTTFSTTGFVSKFAPDGQSLVYSTFLGDPQGYNFCVDMVADGSGGAIAGGLAGGQNFPLKDPLYGAFSEPWRCGFLSRIAPQGGALNFSTFILQQRVVALALDGAGNIYLATMDNTILKVSADGRRLLYEFAMPFADEDTGIEDIAVAAGGALVVAGWTSVWDFPSLRPVQAERGGQVDAFVVTVNPQGDGLEFATRLGGAEDDFAFGVAVDGGGAIYVCGSTASADFPVTDGWAGTRRVDGDAFAAKIDPRQGTLPYAITLGGDGEDRATALAVNAAGEAYLGGWTTSADFPLRGAIRGRLGGRKDAFVAKLGRRGDLLLSTYCGGSSSDPYINIDSEGYGADWGNDICLGPQGHVYLTGETYASDFPLRRPLDDRNLFSKAFIAVLREIRP